MKAAGMKAAGWLALGALACAPSGVQAGEGPRPAGGTLEIPESARDTRNPLRVSREAVQAGKVLWGAHCQTCHGATGKGDGPNARLHEVRKSVRPQDLTSRAVQDGLTDGELFWRISHGILEEDGNVIMPAYRDKVRDETKRWQLVVFVRQLGLDAAGSAGSARK
jgi:mono/diheme cytochrome c family protein